MAKKQPVGERLDIGRGQQLSLAPTGEVAEHSTAGGAMIGMTTSAARNEGECTIAPRRANVSAWYAPAAPPGPVD